MSGRSRLTGDLTVSTLLALHEEGRGASSAGPLKSLQSSVQSSLREVLNILKLLCFVSRSHMIMQYVVASCEVKDVTVYTNNDKLTQKVQNNPN